MSLIEKFFLFYPEVLKLHQEETDGRQRWEGQTREPGIKGREQGTSPLSITVQGCCSLCSF